MLIQPEEFVFVFFKDVAPEWGRRLWAFLNQPDNIGLMSEASDEEIPIPAAEAITTRLLETFGDGIKQERVKQLTGVLIGTVMGYHGYIAAKRGVRCKDQRIFTSASTYARRWE